MLKQTYIAKYYYCTWLRTCDDAFCPWGLVHAVDVPSHPTLASLREGSKGELGA